jgi:beta-phosphoglucomutase-like phosphatase (HAD superfamily)
VVEGELEELQLYTAFDITTTGEEVTVQKPDPEIFLLTAQKLEIDPEQCLVVEDAIAGVRAGKEAGMFVAAFVSEYATEEQLKAAGADYVLKDFSELKDLIVASDVGQE